jgi:hypothetical protein
MAAVSAVNLTIQKGTNFEETFSLTMDDETSANLQGYSAIAKLRKYPTAGVAYTFSTSVTTATGTVKISMPDTVTSTLPSGRCFYDVLIISGNGTVTKAIQGNVIVEETASL